MGELPKRCCECPYFNKGWEQCNKNGMEIYEEEASKWRVSWCPLEKGKNNG